MEELVVKLEDFGLKNFIRRYRNVLCEKTTNQLKIASFLMFDADQSTKIMAPPDNFQRCFNLYELIEKTATASNLIQALQNSNNDHVLKFIESVLMDPLSFGANFSSNPGIWFNIPEPIDSFCGRVDFLVQLHDQLKPRDDAETEVTVLSQVKIVSGLGGIGKTQTARKYIMKQRKFYNNFIWINAENDNLMINCFLKLADKLKIPIKNSEGKPREIEEIVKEIYNKICEGGQSNLIVFDNAEDYLSCRQFFPFGLHPDLTKPVILATSRNQEWISAKGKIGVLPLDKMTYDESLEFILKQLEIPESEIPKFREKSKEFIELIGGLPLALQQAIAYIKHQKKMNSLFGRPYRMSDYVKEFKSSAEKLQKFPHAPDSSQTIFITWEITLKKTKEDPSGKTALELIELMSFLYADKIPVELLIQIFPLPPPPENCINRLCCFFKQQHEDFESTDIVEGLNLLDKLSMIKITGNFVSVHRQVQFVILQNLKSSGRLIKLVDHLLEKCSGILENLKMSESSDIFLSLHQIVKNQFNLIPVTEKFLDFMSEFGDVLWEASRYSESLDVFKKVYSNCMELLGGNHEDTLSAQNNIALNLLNLGRYEESLTLFTETLEKYETHPDLGLDHPDTITTKHGMACVLERQQKYGESLELQQQVLDQRNKVLGANHPKTLTVQNAIASLYTLHHGDFPKALALFQQLEKKQIQVLGPDHPEAIITQQNKAVVLFEMGQFEEASKILNNVYQKQKETLGQNHLHTVTALFLIAETLEQEGKFTEALDIQEKVYEIRKQDLGENHPSTILSKYKIASVLRCQGKYGESLFWLQQVLAHQKKIYGENHPETLDTQNQIALLHSHLGDFSQAVLLFQDLEKKQADLLGPHHENVLTTKHNKACVLYKRGQFEEASRIFNQLYEKRKETLGDNHLDTIDTLECIGTTSEQQGKFKKALDLFRNVFKVRKVDLGEDHPLTIRVKSKIINVQSKIKALSKIE